MPGSASTHDEGPFYQMQRMERYKAVIQQMLAAGTPTSATRPARNSTPCAPSRKRRRKSRATTAAGGPEAGKTLPTPPADVPPVIRFKNPKDGVVAWDDQVKGRIEFANTELDDLIIARADGTPTYNFCVWWTTGTWASPTVIRGDDHVNNTPRQINIYQALGAEVPAYAHLSMILGDDGAKLSKRHGAVSVMQYDEDGFLPEAVINYLARLGWSHGDDEVFSLESSSSTGSTSTTSPPRPAQFNTEKLLWLNQHYMKPCRRPNWRPRPRPAWPPAASIRRAGPDLEKAVALYVDRCNTLNVLADAVEVFYAHVVPNPELLAQHLSDEARPALAEFAAGIANVAWETPAIGALIKETVTKHGLKMPKLAMPLRVILTGQAQTPAVDAVIALIGRDKVATALRHISKKSRKALYKDQ
jgi:glutamyl-tRNA synthetase